MLAARYTVLSLFVRKMSASGHLLERNSLGQVRKDILNGWKEIANYVGRDIRTVERWEKQRGLPIRRVPGAGRATVYAVVTELDEWFASARSQEDEDSVDDVAPIADGFGAAALEGVLLQASAMSSEPPLAIDVPDASPSVAGSSSHTRWWVAGVAAVSLCALAVALVVRRDHREAAASAAHTAATAPLHYSFDAAHNPDGVPYPSRVAGVDELCLRGIYSSEQRTADSLRYSLQYFNQAIAKDPDYAPAYSGLATAYLLTREYAVMSDAKAYPLAEVAAQKAVQLDPNLAQAHASLGFIYFFWIGDPVAAEREFRTALRENSSAVLTHHWYGSVLTHEGRYTEALDQLNLAQHLAPTSAAILSSRALAIGLSGHRDEAVDMMQELLNEVPAAPSPHQIIAILSLVEPRDIPRWLDESRRVSEMRHDTQSQKILAQSEAAYRSGGEKAMWQVIARLNHASVPASEPRPYNEGSAEAALGHFDAAFPILMADAKRHDHESLIVAMDPLLTELRNDPRYPQLLAETRIAEAEKIH